VAPVHARHPRPHHQEARVGPDAAFPFIQHNRSNTTVLAQPLQQNRSITSVPSQPFSTTWVITGSQLRVLLSFVFLMKPHMGARGESLVPPSYARGSVADCSNRSKNLSFPTCQLPPRRCTRS
jgi:hypothetical protein